MEEVDRDEGRSTGTGTDGIRQSPSQREPEMRRKNSVFLMSDFNTQKIRKTNLREQVQQQMRKPSKAVMNPPTLRAGSMTNFGAANGTLRKLNTMIDLAYNNLHGDDEVKDETELAELKEKQKQDEDYYWAMRQDPSYSKYLAKCKRKAEKEFEDFFFDTENEVASLEAKLGVDEASLEKLKKMIESKRKKQQEAEDKKKKALKVVTKDV